MGEYNLSAEEKRKSINALNTLKNLIETYSVYALEISETPYLLKSISIPQPSWKDGRRTLVEKLYATNKGLYKIVTENKVVNGDSDKKVFSNDYSGPNPKIGKFLLTSEHSGIIVDYFSLQSATLFEVIEKIEKELGIDKDKQNLQASSDDEGFFDLLFHNTDNN